MFQNMTYDRYRQFPEIILDTRTSRQLAGYLLIEKDLKRGQSGGRFNL